MLLDCYKTWEGDRRIEYFIIKKKAVQTILVSIVSDYFSFEWELPQLTICHLPINQLPTKVWTRRAKMTTAIKKEVLELSLTQYLSEWTLSLQLHWKWVPHWISDRISLWSKSLTMILFQLLLTNNLSYSMDCSGDKMR